MPCLHRGGCADAARVGLPAEPWWVASSRCAGGRAPHLDLLAGSMCLLSLRSRSVSAMAAMMATSRITAAISSGNRYSVYSSLPSSLVLETCHAAPPARPPARPPGAAGLGGRKPPISTAAISSAITTPTMAASGKCFQKPARRLSTLMSSIITTNRNSTITAPTYTSTSEMARNSALSSIHTAAAWKKASTRYSAAYTGLRAVMTRNAANSSTARTDRRNRS
jgi:hypothetical protein